MGVYPKVAKRPLQEADPQLPRTLSDCLEIVASSLALRTLDNRPVSVPVHANRMKLYCDPSDRPLEPPDVEHSSPDLAESDLPADSFVEDEPLRSRSNSDVIRRADSQEPKITRPEDFMNLR